jgi:coenzyme F420 hydrogenase subunit beta
MFSRASPERLCQKAMIGTALAGQGMMDGTGIPAAAAPALERVARGRLCSGCGGCALVAPGRITMDYDAQGFLRPRQTGPVSAAEDAHIARICPGLGQRVEAGGRRDDVLWGPWLEMRRGHATDAGLRHAASSGGALSALLVHLLDSGAVDGVVQTAADPALPIGNVTVLSEDAAAIQAAAGSRYAPSSPLAALEPHLAGSRRLAFVGKPCDVAALRALAQEDPRVDARFPVMLSFFCAGVPALSGAREVLDRLGMAEAETQAFRYRGQGWPGRATARAQDGREASMSYFDSWGGVLSRHVQHRCKICADGTGKAADLVCADAWECDARGYPLFDEAPGVSLIVARTDHGAAILAAAEAAGQLATAPFDPATLAAIQPGQSGRRRALLARLAALRLLGRPVPHYEGLHLWRAARQGGLRANLRGFLGMVKRGLKARA